MTSIKFKLRRRESARAGVRRVAHGRITNAITRLQDEEADPAEAIHAARKDIKKLRSTLRLVRPVVGDEVYDRENGRFREAAGLLSDVRDAQVRLETVESLAQRFPDDGPPGGWWTVRGILAADDASDADEVASLRQRAADVIEAGDAQIDEWPLERKGFGLLGPGLERSYSRGRKRWREAEADPTDERLHELRKRSKDLWYQLRLVRRGWPEVLATAADEAHELSDLLGDDHDLVVLAGELENGFVALADDQRRHLADLISRRREELQEEAFAYAERIYAEKPKRFVSRIEAYWEAPAL